MIGLTPFANPLLDAAAPGANTDVFDDDLVPKEGGYSKLVIMIQLAVASVVNLMIRHGAIEVKGTINAGVAIPASKLYTFEALVHSDHAYNIQLETDGAIKVLYLSTQKAD